MELRALEKSLERYQGFVVAGLAFILVFAVTMAGVMLWQAYRMGEQANDIKNVAVSTHNSICALRSDLQARRDAAVKFIKEHPGGLVSERTGEVLITRAQLDSSVAAQDATLNALGRGGLQCP